MHTVAAIILAAALPAVTNQSAQVAIMWTDYTNRAARVEAMRAKREATQAAAKAKRDAVQTVRDNLKRRKGAAAVKAAVKKGGK